MNIDDLPGRHLAARFDTKRRRSERRDPPTGHRVQHPNRGGIAALVSSGGKELAGIMVIAGIAFRHGAGKRARWLWDPVQPRCATPISRLAAASGTFWSARFSWERS